MSYLLSCVQGVAKVAISQFSLTASGYDSAMTLLRNSFGARESDERTLAKQLESVNAASASWNDQLSLVLTLKALIAKISRLRPSVQQDVLLQEVIKRKFPQKLRDMLHRFTYNFERVTISTILDKAESFVREELFVASMNDGRNRPSGSKHVVNAANKSAVERKFREAPRGLQQEDDEPKCVYCGKHKLSHDCFTVRLVVDRLQFLRQRGLCTACLKPTGTMHNCRVKCLFCNKSHDASVCMELAKLKTAKRPSEGRNNVKHRGRNDGEQRDRTNYADQPQQQGRHRVMASHCNEEGAASIQTPRLQTGTVNMKGTLPGRCKKVAFLLDTGASVSLVSQSLAEELSLRKLHDVESTVCGLGDRTDAPKMYPMYEVPLRGVNGRTLTVKAMGYPEPIVGTLDYPPLPSSDVEEIRSRKLYMADDCENARKLCPQLLLGNKDYLTLTRVRERRINLRSGYVLLPSLLGWIVTGGGERPPPKAVVAHLVDKRSVQREINSSFQRFLGLEDCVASEKLEETHEEHSAVDEYFQRHVSMKNGRIQARYCMKEEALPMISGNLKAAHARMRNVIHGLEERSMLQHYDEIIRDHIAKNQVEVVQPPDRGKTSWSYLPHHPVYRPEKPEKPIRIVFDASARERGKLSLNDCMRDSLVRLERIPALLIRARCAYDIVLSDVEAAFLQIVVDPSQRDLMRFLWLKDITRPMHDENVTHLRFKVAPFGVSQSPYLLEASIRHLVEQAKNTPEFEENASYRFVLKQLDDNVYVDNVIFECKSDTKKHDVYTAAKMIFARAKLNLREFASNSSAFVQSLPQADQ